MEQEDQKGRLVEGNFQITHQLTQQRSITMSGYLYHGESANELNARIDALQDVMDRQFVRADLKKKEAEREQYVAGMNQHLEHLEKLRASMEATNGHAKRKLSSQERQQLDREAETTEGAKKHIASLDAAIAAAREYLKNSGAQPSA